MKNVLFITQDKYPNGDAGAVRTHAFAKMFQAMGYEPTVVGMGNTTNFEMKKEDGISFVSFRFPESNLISRVKGRLLYHKHLVRMMFQDKSSWDAIVLVSSTKKTLDFLKSYCKKHAVPLLHDSVEWYSPEQFRFGKLHSAYIEKDRWNRIHIDKDVRVISISTYLQEYFQNKGIRTARVPVIMDMKEMAHNKCVDREKVVFVYAGAPGKKDYLHVVVRGFAEMPGSAPYELRLIGVTREQLVNQCGVDPVCIEKLGEHLCCMGRVPRQQVLEELSRADFTVLMRSQQQRYAKAGFPTKFVESLATATPVIANSTSDLGLYLKNGENGYVAEGESPEALADALSQAMALSYEERIAMQCAARKTAESCFDYRSYVKDIEALLGEE